MKDKVNDKNYEMDIKMREFLIKKALNIPFENNPDLRRPTSADAAKKFYRKHFSEYLKHCVLPFEKYAMAKFWFNDAGFQFQWRTHNMLINLECLSWDEVYKRFVVS